MTKVDYRVAMGDRFDEHNTLQHPIVRKKSSSDT